MQGLLADGHSVFVEMSPHPILMPAVEEMLRRRQREGTAVGSLRRGQDERASLLESTGGAVGAGPCCVDWRRLFPTGG